MKDSDFELIMAYCDGETTPEETTKAQALIAASPEAQEAYSRLRALDQRVKSSLSEALREPVPESLKRSVESFSESQRRPLVFPKRRWATNAQWALAASVVLALGAALLWPGGEHSSALRVEGFVHQTLEQVPSGEVGADASSDLKVMPLASYQVSDGRLCREYTRRLGDEVLSGLACRSSNGRWEALVVNTLANAEGFEPAHGPVGPIASRLEELGAGAPLSAEEEANTLGQFSD